MSNIRFSGSSRLQPLLNQYYATSGNVPSSDVLESMVRGEVHAAYANRNAAQELSMRKKQFDESMKEMKRARQANMIGNIGALGMFGLANIDKWLPTVKGMFASKEEGGGDKINLPYGSDYGLVNMNEGWEGGATGIQERKPLSTYTAPYAEGEPAPKPVTEADIDSLTGYPTGKISTKKGIVAPAVKTSAASKSPAKNIAADINAGNFIPSKDFRTWDELANAQRSYNKRYATNSGYLSPFANLVEPRSPFDLYRASIKKPKATAAATTKPFESSWSFGTPSIRR